MVYILERLDLPLKFHVEQGRNTKKLRNALVEVIEKPFGKGKANQRKLFLEVYKEQDQKFMAFMTGAI